MGLFKKRSGMIDVVDMQRRGLVKLPARRPSTIKAGKDGFVELTATGSPATTAASSIAPKEEKSGGGWFGGFFGGDSSSSSSSATPSNSSSVTNFSTEAEGYNKREVDAKIEELDNKIYRMEQRLEVLERKNSVGSW